MSKPLPLCREYDPDTWFPVGTGGPAELQTEKAKSICYACPLRNACLDFAMQYHIYDGIWGGCTADERRVIRRQQHIRVRSIDEGRSPLVRALAS